MGEGLPRFMGRCTFCPCFASLLIQNSIISARFSIIIAHFCRPFCHPCERFDCLLLSFLRKQESSVFIRHKPRKSQDTGSRIKSGMTDKDKGENKQRRWMPDSPGCHSCGSRNPASLSVTKMDKAKTLDPRFPWLSFLRKQESSVFILHKPRIKPRHWILD